MLFAQSESGARIEPHPGTKARCPQCGGELLAKCGSIVQWHWAHRAAECDTWSEGESEWHLAWKRQVDPGACEIVIGEHRADIRTNSGVVVELQHSALAPDEIAERELFYGEMVWLFDARTYELSFYPRGARVDFEWHRPRKALRAVKKPMYWDLGHGFVLHVERIGPEPSSLGGQRGAAVLLDAACFASALFSASARPEVHRAASRRANRVVECSRLAQALLRDQPRLGIDEAFHAALQKVPT